MLSFCPSLMKIASARHATYAIANTTDLLFCPPKKYGGQGRHIRTSCEASCQDLNISTQCNLIKLASFSICCRWAKWYKSEAHAIACCIQPQREIASSQKKEVTTTKLRQSLTTRHVLVWRDIFLCRLWSFQTQLENDGVQCNMRMSN